MITPEIENSLFSDGIFAKTTSTFLEKTFYSKTINNSLKPKQFEKTIIKYSEKALRLATLSIKTSSICFVNIVILISFEKYIKSTWFIRLLRKLDEEDFSKNIQLRFY